MPRTTHTAALALGYADRLVVSTARDVHRAVARRAFGATRRIGGSLPEAVHDRVADLAYAGVSLGVRGSGRLLERAADRGIGASLEASTTGRYVVSAVNALVGSELAERGDRHAIEMAVRVGGRDVEIEAESLRAAYPRATDRIAIFLHGLGENDDSWRLAERAGSGTYPSRVEDDTDYTPVLIRYNTGLNVSANGELLSALVTRLIDAWPVAVSRLAFVGHSMGGLVARSAGSHGVAGGTDWPRLVRQVVCLGTPHLGAPLEKAVHLGSRALSVVPETAPFGRILDTRSPGIVDLRHGYISREEWSGQDLTRRWGLDRLAAAPLPYADYHFVAATIGNAPGQPASRLFGDLFVRLPSAHGRSARGGSVVPGALTDHVGGADHFALLNYPEVAECLVAWFDESRSSLPAVPAVPPTTGGDP
ncbi:esterase/lipase family protein [Solicola gregarius]|uniref:GPI inositol-deacylase n=1 Tax=Solicola gregarius TaxID=2908642 RepID=A0AA46YKA9_9ACTN|nr:hypothetical protein [Solicola gregarius]UYM04286.1 GPI inositol-deacylase [Solicola gregarius]